MSLRDNSTESLELVGERMKEDLRLIKRELSRRGSRRRVYDKGLSVLYRKHLSRANRKGLVFELDPDYFDELVSGVCVYCGSGDVGVGRKDMSVGYTVENSQPCCGVCGMMKQSLGEDEFLGHLRRVVDHLSL